MVTDKEILNMKFSIAVLLLLLVVTVFSSSVFSAGTGRHRLVILADMGNEPDEEQQMVHMIVCCNEFDLEGLIAVTGKYLRPESNDPYKQRLHPELFLKIIDAYARVVDNLKRHARGWHEPDYLKSIVVEGQTGYGIADVGDGKSSPGSQLIVDVLNKIDPRPVWLVVNAGSNTLAQALWDIREKQGSQQADALVARLRVFENGAQDNAGAWICANFPKIHWIRSNYQTYCYGGPSNDGVADNQGEFSNLGPHVWQPFAYSETGQHQWALEHIKGNHGPLGVCWPIRQFGGGRISFLEGGGTIPWLGLVNKGLFDIDHPHWGGWSGRFSREKQENYWSKHTSVRVDEEKVAPFEVYKEAAGRWTDPESGKTYDSIFVPVWRWRRAMYNDFVCRMDWCVKSFDEANHHPVAAVNGDTGDTILRMAVDVLQTLTLDAAASSDPDGEKLEYRWWIYKEAGTFDGDVELDNTDAVRTQIIVPEDAGGKQIHLVLEVSDRNPVAPLYDYRRVVIDVQ